MQRSGPPEAIDNASTNTYQRFIFTRRSEVSAGTRSFALRRPGGYGEGTNTRSHPELGRENPQRQWYCVLRRGRVGRRQVFSTQNQNNTARTKRIPSRKTDARGQASGIRVPLLIPDPRHPIRDLRGVEQPGSSSGS